MSSIEKISFLIIAYNSLEITIHCFESLLCFENEEEILFLDNGSKEPLAPVLRKKFSSRGVQTFRSEINLGVAGGRNYLLSQASGEYLVFMDNDVGLTDRVSQKIKENLENPSIGVYGQRGIMFSDDLRPFVVAAKEVDAIAGFFQCFRKDLSKEIGLLDENFKIYGQEDFDFCLRAKMARYKIISDNSLPLIHHEHKSSLIVAELEDYKQKNFQYFFDKWKNSLGILEIERKKINRLSCLNCSEIWERK